MPMTMAAAGPTYPAAGVMATRPATAPETTPRDAGRPLYQLAHIQARAPAAAAVFVTTNAFAARPFAASALPALNPNQPNQSIAAPRRAKGMFEGSMLYSPNPLRFPMTRAIARAPNPALIWTTVPPAKSSAPIAAIKPPPQTQWARGS